MYQSYLDSARFSRGMTLKIRLEIKFVRFSIVKMSNFTFNRILMTIRKHPYSLQILGLPHVQFYNFQTLEFPIFEFGHSTLEIVGSELY